MGDDEDAKGEPAVPADPFVSPLAGSAVQIHEMVVEFQQAGFTRREAIHIVMSMMLSAMGGHDDDDDDEVFDGDL